MEDKDTQQMIDSIETIELEAAYGRAMLAAHSLEQSLYLLLLTRLPEVIGKDNNSILRKKITKLKRLTLGPLIERFISEFKISEYWQEELDNMLFFRNRLVHQISDDLSSSFLRHRSKQKLIVELEEIKTFFVETDQEMKRMLFELFDEKGIQKEKFYEAAMRLFSEAKNKAERA